MGVNGEPGCGSSEVEPDIKSGELEVLEAEAGAGALDDTERFVWGYGWYKRGFGNKSSWIADTVARRDRTSVEKRGTIIGGGAGRGKVKGEIEIVSGDGTVDMMVSGDELTAMRTLLRQAGIILGRGKRREWDWNRKAWSWHPDKLHVDKKSRQKEQFQGLRFLMFGEMTNKKPVWCNQCKSLPCPREMEKTITSDYKSSRFSRCHNNYYEVSKTHSLISARALFLESNPPGQQRPHRLHCPPPTRYSCRLRRYDWKPCQTTIWLRYI